MAKAKGNAKRKGKPAARVVEALLWAPMEFRDAADFGTYIAGSEAWYVVDLAKEALEQGDEAERSAAALLLDDFQGMVATHAELLARGNGKGPIRVEIQELSCDPEVRFERLGHLLALATRIECNGDEGAISDWAKRMIAGLAAELKGMSYRLRMIDRGQEAA